MWCLSHKQDSLYSVWTWVAVDGCSLTVNILNRKHCFNCCFVHHERGLKHILVDSGSKPGTVVQIPGNIVQRNACKRNTTYRVESTKQHTD